MTWKIKVKKRLGKIEKFDKGKIASSIFKAARRVGGKDRRLASALSQKVEDFLKEKFPKSKIITTEEIGNAVEKVLIEEGHAKTAKTFILYREGQRRARKKLIKLKDLPRLFQFLKLTDRKSVFTSGVYDLLHIGHVRYLKRASLQGDVLIVGLNSDTSARRLKGKERPVLGEEVRAEMLSFLEFVDFIVIYPQVTAANVISRLKPDVYVCIEGSWEGNLEQKAEVKAVRKYGGKVVVLPYQSPELSTTTIVNRIKSKENPFQNIQLAAAAFLIEDGKVLLVKQKNHQFWTPPGGLVDVDEDPQTACVREVKEELGLQIICYGILPPAIFQDETFQKRILVLNYLARRDRNQEININTRINQIDEGGVEKYQWARFENLKKLLLAPNVLPVVEKIKNNFALQKSSKIGKTKSKKDWSFMKKAQKEAKNSTCWFRKVGCVAVRDRKILLSAYNKIMPDEDFCKRMGCIREKLGVLPGEKLELCDVLHAEANLISLAAKKGISLKGTAMYLTSFPCPICAKAIANSGIEKLVFLGEYSNFEGLPYLESRKVTIVRLEENGSQI